MRKSTELSANLRGYCRNGMGDSVWDESVNKRVPSALAVLAVNESRFMFLLVKLSECTDGVDRGLSYEHEAGSAVVT